MATTKKTDSKSVTIKAPNLNIVVFKIEGTAPYVQHKFSTKARQQIMATQAAGSQAKSKKVREPKNFDEVYRNAMHVSTEGWPGIPASSFRNAAISACRLIGFKMTLAKLAFFTLADGYDEDGTPLIKINGEPHRHDGYARNDNGSVDIRCRPMWDEWSATVRVQYDADIWSVEDVTALFMRVGMQVGIGEGRPDSKNSAGMGWGTFRLVNDKQE